MAILTVMSPVRAFTHPMRALRRFRRGEPVVVVSGLPRSGTSMMMQMLEAGGMEIFSEALDNATPAAPEALEDEAPASENPKKAGKVKKTKQAKAKKKDKKSKKAKKSKKHKGSKKKTKKSKKK